MKLRNWMKCKESFISLVKISAGLDFPATWVTVIRFRWIASRTRFSRIWMCLILRLDLLWHHWTQAVLSLKIGGGPGVRNLWRFKSWIMCWRFRRSLTHSLVEYISASAVLCAVDFWCLVSQWSGPWRRIIWPEIERVLKRSTVSLVLGGGLEASWGPQLESVYDVSLLRGKWINVWASICWFVVKKSPSWRVPARYLRANWAAYNWPGLGLFWYFAKMEVMVDKSGRVEWASQLREPIIERYICWRGRNSCWGRSFCVTQRVSQNDTVWWGIYCCWDRDLRSGECCR